MVTNKKNFGTPHVVKIWLKSAKINFLEEPKWSMMDDLGNLIANVKKHVTYNFRRQGVTLRCNAQTWSKETGLYMAGLLGKFLKGTGKTE